MVAWEVELPSRVRETDLQDIGIELRGGRLILLFPGTIGLNQGDEMVKVGGIGSRR